MRSRQPYLTHQPADLMTANTMTNRAQVARLPRTIELRLKELLVDEPHEYRVRFSLPDLGIVEPRPADTQQLALSANRQMRMIRPHQFPAPRHAHRPEAFAKKSRSATSQPIRTCSLVSSASLTAAAAFGENVVVIP